MSRDGEENKDLETEIMHCSGGGFGDGTTGVLTRQTFGEGVGGGRGSGNAERDFDARTIGYGTP